MRGKNLQPIFKEKIEGLCMNANYPSIYKKRDYFDVPVISPPSNLSMSLQHVTLEPGEKKAWIPDSCVNVKQNTIEFKRTIPRELLDPKKVSHANII